MYLSEQDIETDSEGAIKYYDINADCTAESEPSKREATSLAIADKGKAALLGLCCLCTACPCLCHTTTSATHHFNNENFVRYLFDYDLFSFPHNFHRSGYLIAYLQHEGIIANTCVVATDSHCLRGPYARPVLSKSKTGGGRQEENDGVYADIVRSATHGNLEFRRPTNLIEPVSAFPDVRMLMRNYVLTDPSRDWLDLRYALQMPTFLIYIKLSSSINHVPSADFTALFDMRQLRVNENGPSIGLQLARLVAGIRQQYFNVPLPNLKLIEKKFHDMLLDVSLGKNPLLSSLDTTAPPHFPTSQGDVVNQDGDSASRSAMNSAAWVVPDSQPRDETAYCQ